MTVPQKTPQTREAMASASGVAGGGGNRPHGTLDAPRSNASPNKPHYDAAGRFIHTCGHPGCSLWGGFGFGVSLRAGRLGRWFCAEHAKEYRRQVEAERAKPQPRPQETRPAHRSDAKGQGRLF